MLRYTVNGLQLLDKGLVEQKYAKHEFCCLPIRWDLSFLERIEVLMVCFVWSR